MKPPVLDYCRVRVTDELGLLFIGRILDMPGPTLTLCKPDGEPLFTLSRDRVQQLTHDQFARCLAEEARYQRALALPRN